MELEHPAAKLGDSRVAVQLQFKCAADRVDDRVMEPALVDGFVDNEIAKFFHRDLAAKRAQVDLQRR